MLKVTVEKDWHEPSPDLPVILDFLSVLPSQHLQGVGVWSQEGIVSNSIDRTRDDEKQDLEERNPEDELLPSQSRA